MTLRETSTLKRRVASRDATIAKLRAQLAEHEERERNAWQRDERQWPAHVAGYTCRRAVEGAARKHGTTLGPTFRVLLVRRLREVDTHGGVLDAGTATRLVETWAHEGVRARKQ